MNTTRVKVGIDGLDDMLNGGLREGSICGIIGTYGTGKTTFALQFIFEGIANEEKVLYISLEEREEQIIENINNRGWEVDPYINKQLFILRLDPTDFNLAINSIKNELPDLIEEVGATRVVIDPISLFEGLFDDPSMRRKEMFRFTEIMRDLPCTFLLTSESDKDDPYASKYGLLEYLSDTIIVLRYIRSDEHTEVHTALEVVKMRRSTHSREIKPYEITSDVINVYSEASVF